MTDRRRLALTTDPGLDDLVLDELIERDPDAVALEPRGTDPGRVVVETAAGAAAVDALGLVHDVIELRGAFTAGDLDALRDAVAGVEVPELARAASFRVRSTGGGGLDRRAVEGASGGALQRRYGTPVDLTRPAVVVRVDGVDGRFQVGVQLNRDPLSRRIRRGTALRSSLRPTVAAALVRLAGAHRRPGKLIDPLCGSGVIPVEAARVNPRLSIEASDWDAPTVAVAAQTFENHGLDIEPEVLDARSLGARRPGAFRYVVTDPPYGMRQGRRTHLGTLYADLLRSFERALEPGGCIALVVVRHRVLDRAAEAASLEIVHRRTVDAAGLSLTLFVLQPAKGGG